MSNTISFLKEYREHRHLLKATPYVGWLKQQARRERRRAAASAIQQEIRLNSEPDPSDN